MTIRAWASRIGIVGGALLAVTPPLVEFVAGEFILLLPLGFALAIVATLMVAPIRRSALGRIFLVALSLALVAEVAEQVSANPPKILDVLPPFLFSASGIALLVAAREARHTHAPSPGLHADS